jgi:hypothetical protein
MSAVVIVFGVCVVTCLVGHVAILHSVVKRGTQRADAGVPRPRLAAELTWAVIPMLVLALVLTASWVKVRANATPKPEMIMKVAR